MKTRLSYGRIYGILKFIMIMLVVFQHGIAVIVIVLLVCFIKREIDFLWQKLMTVTCWFCSHGKLLGRFQLTAKWFFVLIMAGRGSRVAFGMSSGMALWENVLILINQRYCQKVGNIPFDCTEEQLIDVFKEVGPVESFRCVIRTSFVWSVISRFNWRLSKTCVW